MAGVEDALTYKLIKQPMKESSSVHTVKFSKENNTYQVWKGDHLVTDYTTKERAEAEAKRLNHLDNAKKTDRAQVKENYRTQIAKLVKEVLAEKKLTTAEKNKKEDIVKGLKKSGFKKDDPATYAIATAKAKKLK
jgi:hypothetical protein